MGTVTVKAVASQLTPEFLEGLMEAGALSKEPSPDEMVSFEVKKKKLPKGLRNGASYVTMGAIAKETGVADSNVSKKFKSDQKVSLPIEGVFNAGTGLKLVTEAAYQEHQQRSALFVEGAEKKKTSNEIRAKHKISEQEMGKARKAVMAQLGDGETFGSRGQMNRMEYTDAEVTRLVEMVESMRTDKQAHVKKRGGH